MFQTTNQFTFLHSIGDRTESVKRRKKNQQCFKWLAFFFIFGWVFECEWVRGDDFSEVGKRRKMFENIEENWKKLKKSRNRKKIRKKSKRIEKIEFFSTPFDGKSKNNRIFTTIGC